MDIKTEWKKFRAGTLLDFSIDTCEDFMELPRKERTAFGFWYITAKALSWHRQENGTKKRLTPRDIFDGTCGFSAIKKFHRKHFPVQYFFREFIWHNLKTFWERKVLGSYGPYWYHKLYAKFFNDRQKWLRKEIPYFYADTTYLFPKLSFCMLQNFIEKEANLDDVYDFYWEDSDSQTEERKEFFKKAYKILKEDIPDLKTKKDNYEEIEKREEIAEERGLEGKECYEFIYKKQLECEKRIFELETFVLNGMVKHRECLWT